MSRRHYDKLREMEREERVKRKRTLRRPRRTLPLITDRAERNAAIVRAHNIAKTGRMTLVDALRFEGVLA